MQVSLRKANTLQNSINEALKGIELKTTVSLNEFQNVSEVIAEARTTTLANVVRRAVLLDALYEIRKSVSAANFQSGINDKLADVALFDKEVSFIDGLSRNGPQIDINVLNGKIAKIANRVEDAYSSYNYEVSTSVFSTADIADFKSKISSAKKSKQALQDDLLELNIKTTIDLSDQTVTTLKNEGIL